MQAIARGERDAQRAVERGRAELAPPLREAYLDVVDPRTFVPEHEVAVPALAIGSAWIGTTRLIDNEPIEASA